MLITLARKPTKGGTVVANALQHGCGALNINASRITVSQEDPNRRNATGEPGGADSTFGVGNSKRPATLAHKEGRWPSNLILPHMPGCQCVGTTRVRTQFGQATERSTSKFGDGWGLAKRDGLLIGYADASGMETVESWVCLPGCSVAALNRQSGDRPSTMTGRAPTEGAYHNPGRSDPMASVFVGVGGGGGTVYADSGGASRFFKQVGASGC